MREEQSPEGGKSRVPESGLPSSHFHRARRSEEPAASWATFWGDLLCWAVGVFHVQLLPWLAQNLDPRGECIGTNLPFTLP